MIVHITVCTIQSFILRLLLSIQLEDRLDPCHVLLLIRLGHILRFEARASPLRYWLDQDLSVEGCPHRDLFALLQMLANFENAWMNPCSTFDRSCLPMSWFLLILGVHLVIPPMELLDSGLPLL